MSKLADCAKQLLALINAVPALNQRVGLRVGGGATDPAMLTLPLPAAWVLLTGDRPLDPAAAVNPRGQMVEITYSVMVYVANVSQSDLIDAQIPLLESVIVAVHGQQSPSGHKWKYGGQRLVVVNTDKLGYEQRFTVPMFL